SSCPRQHRNRPRDRHRDRSTSNKPSYPGRHRNRNRDRLYTKATELPRAAPKQPLRSTLRYGKILAWRRGRYCTDTVLAFSSQGRAPIPCSSRQANNWAQWVVTMG
ncbi:unnamed protein product, partial [Tuber aestivum]